MHTFNTQGVPLALEEGKGEGRGEGEGGVIQQIATKIVSDLLLDCHELEKEVFRSAK